VSATQHEGKGLPWGGVRSLRNGDRRPKATWRRRETEVQILRREMVLPADRHAAQQARAALDEAIPPSALEGRSEDPRLALTELVSNAVRHAGLEHGQAVISLLIEAYDDHVRVQVEQPTSAGDVHVVERPDIGENPGGFGLRLVQASADSWGYEPGPPGRVWFEFRT
jgi:anti-sigma regulatory factor (Ser/Thr protein kinase)